MSANVYRWVITHVGSCGMRQLTFAKQGRYTYANSRDAREALESYKQPGGLDRVLKPEMLATLDIRIAECYPGHFDPVSTWYD